MPRRPLGGYRQWAVQVGRCDLCTDERLMCFTFDDNEGYSIEVICRDCLWEALRLVNEAILKEEQKPQ